MELVDYPSAGSGLLEKLLDVIDEIHLGQTVKLSIEVDLKSGYFVYVNGRLIFDRQHCHIKRYIDLRFPKATGLRYHDVVAYILYIYGFNLELKLNDENHSLDLQVLSRALDIPLKDK